MAFSLKDGRVVEETQRVFDPLAMDEAAEVAAAELEKLNPDSVAEVANWLKTHYLRAGYKRLGRVLLTKAD